MQEWCEKEMEEMRWIYIPELKKKLDWKEEEKRKAIKEFMWKHKMTLDDKLHNKRKMPNMECTIEPATGSKQRTHDHSFF